MKITIEPDLTTSAEYFFAYPFKIFKNQGQATKFLKIPLQQRDYDWGNDDLINEDGSNIDGLLEDLDYHIAYSDDNYFAGTVLLENQDNSYLKLIDGQQRVTTLYLLNFIGYLIGRHRLENMPTYPSAIQYALEFKDRFDTFIRFEKRAFLVTLSDDLSNLINQQGEIDSNEDLKKRIGKGLNAEQEYWSNIKFRLQFDDIDINASFIETIKKSMLSQQGGALTISGVKSTKNLYSNGLKIILNYLLEHNNQGPLSIDTYLKELVSILEKYLYICGLASIISEDSDDSFRLFEILNDRGQDLSALDLIKNLILEKCSRTGVEIKGFPKEWKRMKENVNKSFSKGKADSIFIENIIRSEGSTLKSKEISYLNNKLASERDIIFKEEEVSDFFLRLLSSSQILKSLNENIHNNKSNNTSSFNRFPMSCFQYVTFMKMINYNWGPQVILCSNIQYLKSTKYLGGLDAPHNQDWKNNNSNSSICDLNHFTRFLGDIMLKLGLFGIVNGLATKGLPTASKEVALMIIRNVRTNPNDFNKSTNLIKLKNEIISYLNFTVFSTSNVQLFESRLSDTFVASTGQKKNLVKILLYFIYNQGGQIHNIKFPELEHLEPLRPTQGANPYYNGADRDELVNRLGNFALIEKEFNNSNFSNKPLIEKIRLATTDPEITKFAIFQNDIFLNINVSNPKIYSAIYGDMPLIKQAQSSTLQLDDSFDITGEPQQNFFLKRSKFLAALSKKYVCNTDSFLDGSGNY